MIEPGTELGPLRKSVAEEVGIASLSILAPATHDTASAVAAVPALHRELRRPARLVLPQLGHLVACWASRSPARSSTTQTLKYNFTNEGGVAGTTRLLKNIMGLWIVQECRRTWARAGRDFSYEELIPRAEAARPFAALVDPDDPSFLAPGDMPARLAAALARTGQRIPGRARGPSSAAPWRAWR